MNKNFSKAELQKIFSAAEGKWKYILESLGINSSYLKNKHGPCPICSGKDRFRFDDKNCGAFICNRCGAGNGIKLLQLYHSWNFNQTLDRITRILRLRPSTYNSSQPQHISNFLKLPSFPNHLNENQYNDGKEKIKNLLHESKSITFNDSVDHYLQSRGMRLTSFPNALRFHPALPYYEEGKLISTHEAMLALVTDVNNKLVTLHRTYLSHGRKANVSHPKKLMPIMRHKALQGAAIKLFEPDDGQIILAEGIETALSLHIATSLPVWATISANGMKQIIIPEHINEVIIAVDNDKSNTGQNAAIALSRKLLLQGKKVRRILPEKIGTDFNDVLLEESV